MGAWGPKAFDNDTACDWAAALARTSNAALVKQALVAVCVSDEECVDANRACEALAACEVVARLQGHWGTVDPYTADVDEWVQAHPAQLTPELVDYAGRAIDRILARGSELRELWRGSVAWQNEVADLRSRVLG